jgi:hypothetical protein
MFYVYKFLFDLFKCFMFTNSSLILFFQYSVHFGAETCNIFKQATTASSFPLFEIHLIVYQDSDASFYAALSLQFVERSYIVS